MNEQNQPEQEEIGDPKVKAAVQRFLDSASKISQADRARVEKERREFDARQRQFKVDSLLVEAELPRLHRQMKDLKWEGPWGKALDQLKLKLGSGFMFILCGIRGNGKTQLGVEVLREACGRLLTARYCTAVEFFMDLKACYHKEGPMEREVLKEYRAPQVLVMDEIGQRGQSEWEDYSLYELFNRRYGDQKDTLLLSNHTREALTDVLGDSLISRLNEKGGVIECNWPSFRK